MPNIIRLDTVKAKTGISRSSIYARMDKNDFPEAVALGGNSVGWYEHEINEWLANRKFVKRNLRKGRILGVESLPLFEYNPKHANEG